MGIERVLQQRSERERAFALELARRAELIIGCPIGARTLARRFSRARQRRRRPLSRLFVVVYVCMMLFSSILIGIYSLFYMLERARSKWMAMMTSDDVGEKSGRILD